MKKAFLILAALLFAGPAFAQTFDFQSGSYFEGAPSNIRLDFGGPGSLVALNLVLDAGSGNYKGTGHLVLNEAGASIDDAAAQVIVIPGAPAGSPACAQPRVHYISAIVLSGNSGGTPYAIASSAAFFIPGGECQAEWLQFAGAVGAPAIRTLDLSRYDARVRLAIRQFARRESLGGLKASFR